MTVHTAAADWDARLRNPDCSDAERASFRAWCEADPSHRQAYDLLQDAVSTLLSAAHYPEMRALRDAALNEGQTRDKRRYALVACLALFALMLPVAASLLMPGQARPGQIETEGPTYYATTVGQRSGITLEDGSVITLNTDSRVHVDYSGEQRLITLLKGQALFEVAKDPDRPFIVTAGSQRVLALGTTFDVRLNETAVEVILVEGKVEIEELPAAPGKQPTPLVQLASGERLVASPAARQPEVTRIDTNKATSWREGYVTFEDTPLPEAIAEMNRYSTVRIVPEGDGISTLHITGLFRAGQQARFTEALQVYFPIEAKRDGNVIVLKMSQSH